MVMSAPRTLRITRLGRADEVLALEQDLARGMARGGVVEELHDRQRGDRLAGAGLADDGQRFALVEGEGDPVDGEHRLAVVMEGDGQVAHVEERRGHR